jgi:haloacetate dehalogenase
VIEGFEYRRIEIGPAGYTVGVAGSGRPVLLLHGFPENHYCWHLVAPRLADDNTVVVTDLRGYGQSTGPEPGPLGEGYSKREMAADLVRVMRELGHERFAVVGHDRGARAAYRMALDHPGCVDCLVVLNIVPTVDQFERMAGDAAIEYYPWFFLAQPPPFAETLVNNSAEYFLRQTLESWTTVAGAITPEATECYLATFTPRNVAAICADYRAAFHIDRPLDAEDRERGARIACPVTVHWSADESAISDDPLVVWRRWANWVEGSPFASGHFIPEEAPDELLSSLRTSLGR